MKKMLIIISVLFSVSASAQLNMMGFFFPQSAGSGTSYLTWFSTSNMEQYNSNKGIRKTAIGNAWNSSAFSNETISSGESVTWKVDGTGVYRIIGLNPTQSESGVTASWTYGLYIQNNNTIYKNDETYTSPTSTGVTVADGDLVRFSYGASMVIEKSTDGGANWTTVFTHPTTPSGSYYSCINVYTSAAGFSEVYK